IQWRLVLPQGRAQANPGTNPQKQKLAAQPAGKTYPPVELVRGAALPSGRARPVENPGSTGRTARAGDGTTPQLPLFKSTGTTAWRDKQGQPERHGHSWAATVCRI